MHLFFLAAEQTSDPTLMAATETAALVAGLKNSILVALMILIVHMLLKSNANDVPAVLSATSSTPGPQTWHEPEKQQQQQQEVDAAAADLLKYVYGGAGDDALGALPAAALPGVDRAATDAATLPEPPRRAAPSSSSSTGAEVTAMGRVSKEVLSTPPPMTATGLQMTTAYANEDAMCGGALFNDSAVQGYDGVGSSYALLK